MVLQLALPVLLLPLSSACCCPWNLMGFSFLVFPDSCLGKDYCVRLTVNGTNHNSTNLTVPVFINISIEKVEQTVQVPF